MAGKSNRTTEEQDIFRGRARYACRRRKLVRERVKFLAEGLDSGEPRLPEGRVGSKGELFPPKDLRDKARLRPLSRVSYTVEDGRLVIEPIPSLEELMAEPPVVEMSPAEFKRFRRELSKKAES